MRQYAVRHEDLLWFEKPGGVRTFHAGESATPYTDTERRVALAKAPGRVTEDSLDRGRPATTFIDIPRENSRSRERSYGRHPSMKPLLLCDRHVRVHSRPGDLVLIPFGGSGSEFISSMKLGRRAIAFEREPSYVEMIIRRLRGHQLVHDILVERP